MFKVNNFFFDIRNAPELSGLVSVYNDKPAIAENFDKQPEGVYFALCDINKSYNYCPNETYMLRMGRFTFSLKIVGEKNTPRALIRDVHDVIEEWMQKYRGNNVYKIDLESCSNFLIDPNTGRPFMACNYTAFFNGGTTPQ